MRSGGPAGSVPPPASPGPFQGPGAVGEAEGKPGRPGPASLGSPVPRARCSQAPSFFLPLPREGRASVRRLPRPAPPHTVKIRTPVTGNGSNRVCGCRLLGPSRDWGLSWSFRPQRPATGGWAAHTSCARRFWGAPPATAESPSLSVRIVVVLSFALILTVSAWALRATMFLIS